VRYEEGGVDGANQNIHPARSSGQIVEVQLP
jgi:hypothetical protein